MAKTRKPPPPPPPPPPAETPSPQRRRKKKGRPSLLDLQRRSLRLQNQNPSPAASPTRRDPNPSDDDDDGAGSGRRRQKRLKSVLSGVVKEESGEGKKDAAKATGKGVAALDGGPTGTPLPDKKLLLFILDRLQKKDTYGVFSEPVDSEELPDYHEIIVHPMDFSTIREKLLNDSYSNLEQFEDDVFLLTSNAMSYNSADTIYYRQARSIEALAKKDFENLRQPSDEEEEPKPPARRGRPPKNPKMEDDVSPDLSSVKTNKPEDNGDTIRKRATADRTRNTNAPLKDSSTFHSIFGSFSAKRTDKISDYSGSSKWGKKPPSLDDDRRSTYDQHYSRNSSLFAAFDDERKLLVPVGVQQQHAYARSLARFAAKLGPVGWDIAANRIRRALPPGTNFGPGWVVDGEPPQNSQLPPVVTSTNPSSESTAPNMPSKVDALQKSGLSSNGDVTGEEHLTRTQTVASTSASFDRSSEIASKVIKHENGVNKLGGGMDNAGPAHPLQHHSHNREIIQSNSNGFAAMSNAMGQYAAQGLFGSGISMTHAQVLGMFSGMNGKANGFIHGHQLTAESLKTAQNGDVGKATVNPVQGAGHDPKIVSDNNSAHPSLNAAIQSSASPPRGKLANAKHPDLALQL